MLTEIPKKFIWIAKAKIDKNSCPDPTTGCWLWLGATSTNGYGVSNICGKTAIASRISYIAYKGSIPEFLELDHLCRTPCCVNPDHLEPVTRLENMRRSRRWGVVPLSPPPTLPPNMSLDQFQIYLETTYGKST